MLIIKDGFLFLESRPEPANFGERGAGCIT